MAPTAGGGGGGDEGVFPEPKKDPGARGVKVLANHSPFHSLHLHVHSSFQKFLSLVTLQGCSSLKI
jgi:hypothetical protein